MDYHVTEVLSVLRADSGIPVETLERAGKLGQDFHSFSLGNLVTPIGIKPPAEIAADVLDFQVWFRDNVRRVVMINGQPFVEKRFSLPALQLTGRIDLVAVMKGDRKPSLIDLKRVYAVSPVVGLQIAAYRFGALAKFGVDCHRGFALQVKNGQVKAIEFSDYKDDLQAFWHSHALYLWSHKKGLVKTTQRG